MDLFDLRKRLWRCLDDFLDARCKGIEIVRREYGIANIFLLMHNYLSCVRD